MIGCSFVSGTADTGNSTETEAETAPESPVAEVVEPTKQATLAPTDPPADTTTTTVKTTPTPVKARVFTNIKVLTLVETKFICRFYSLRFKS